MTRRFPRSARVRTRAEYDRIFQHGRRVALPVLALHWRAASHVQADGASSLHARPLASPGSTPAACPDTAAPDTDASAGAKGAAPQPPMPAATDAYPRQPTPPPGRAATPSTSALHGKDAPASPGSTPDPTAPRLGLAVSRKVDRRAVVRNRIKRGLRETFRAYRMQLAPGEYVVVARPGAAALDTDALQRTLLTLLRRAGALPPVPPAGTMPPAACTDRVQPPSR